MKSIKIAGLCLVAMFALSMVAVGAASAAELPVIVQCRENAGKGQWEDSQCSKAKVKGNWETREGGALKDETFSSVSGPGELRSAAGTIKCSSDTNEGEITGPKHILVVVHFHGCESSGFKCNTAGAPEGQINTTLLKGWIIYLNKAAKKVGVFLEPKTGTEFTAGEIECFIVKTKVTGCVAGEFTKPKVNVFSTTAELTFSEIEEAGKKRQNPNKVTYEGVEKNCFLTAFNEEAVLINADTLTFQFDTMILA